jgi:hypothetical protein
MSSHSAGTAQEDHRVDPELEALSTISALLLNLPEASQRRILKWLSSRFEVAVDTKRSSSESTLTGEPSKEFPDAATLFVATNPRTGGEKALTIGFWLQECLHQEDWDGFTVNTELKHLGHGLKNVTDALNALIEHRPQLVVQLRKSGKTKQARKRYKLTVEGIRKVRQMLSLTSDV